MKSSFSLIVLTGKTASGKDTVMAELLLRLPDFKRIITTTSRAPRYNEKDGVDYHFIPESDFRQKIGTGDFIEHVKYGGNLYGTEKAQITENLTQNFIWRIDPSRAGQMRKLIREAFDPDTAEDLLKRLLVIYLTVNDDVILGRLQRRGLTKEEISKRMQEDAKFWQEFKTSYDHVVENIPGKLDETVHKVISLIQKH